MFAKDAIMACFCWISSFRSEFFASKKKREKKAPITIISVIIRMILKVPKSQPMTLPAAVDSKPFLGRRLICFFWTDTGQSIRAGGRESGSIYTYFSTFPLFHSIYPIYHRGWGRRKVGFMCYLVAGLSRDTNEVKVEITSFSFYLQTSF